MNERYAELYDVNESALRRVRARNLKLGLPAHCVYCGASARTFSAPATVDFRCSTRWVKERGWKRSGACRRIADEDNAEL